MAISGRNTLRKRKVKEGYHGVGSAIGRQAVSLKKERTSECTRIANDQRGARNRKPEGGKDAEDNQGLEKFHTVRKR